MVIYQWLFDNYQYKENVLVALALKMSLYRYYMHSDACHMVYFVLFIIYELNLILANYDWQLVYEELKDCDHISDMKNLKSHSTYIEYFILNS